MKFLADENFPYKSVLYLRSNGFEITSIGEENPSIQDREIMRIAIDEERTILTFDRDYGELIFKYNLKPHKGVIYLRLDTYQADESGKIIENLIHEMRLDFDNT